MGHGGTVNLRQSLASSELPTYGLFEAISRFPNHNGKCPVMTFPICVGASVAEYSVTHVSHKERCGQSPWCHRRRPKSRRRVYCHQGNTKGVKLCRSVRKCAHSCSRHVCFLSSSCLSPLSFWPTRNVLMPLVGPATVCVSYSGTDQLGARIEMISLDEESPCPFPPPPHTLGLFGDQVVTVV